MEAKTKDKWMELIKAQQKSDLTVAQFCHDHNINRKSFYNWRSKISTLSEMPSFINVQTTMPAISLSKNHIQLYFLNARLSLPNTISPTWVAALLKELAL